MQAFNRPHVQLVDTAGMGIEGFTERGVRANGTEFEVDVIVLATGFEQLAILELAHLPTAPLIKL